MEVTMKNFEEVLEEFPKLLRKAQFVAIDTEFTGLTLEDSKFNFYHTLKEWYHYQRKLPINFLVVQVGICLFEYVPEKDKFLYNAFNFYIYPPSTSKKKFGCQVSNMTFLAEHGCDFNKLFREGIPYLTQVEVDEKLEYLEKQRRHSEKAFKDVKVPPGKHKLIEEAMKKIRGFIASDETEIVVADKCNGFIQNLIVQTASNTFQSGVSFEVDKIERRVRAVKIANEDERKQREEDSFAAEKNQIDKEIGFSKILKLITASNLPVVGHNLTIDLLYIVHHCLYPLPQEYVDFRQMISEVFPKIIDTKYLAIAGLEMDNRKTALEDLKEMYAQDRRHDVQCVVEGRGFEKESENYHEAGYDAYITGLIFLSMVDRIGDKKGTNIFKSRLDTGILAQLLNKLHIASLHNITCLDLTGEYTAANRDDVVYITFPPEWTMEHLKRYFKELGYLQVRWLDNSSAFLSVGKEFLPKLKKMKECNKQSSCKMFSYQEYQQRHFGEKTEGEVLADQKHKRVCDEDLGVAVEQKKPRPFPVPSFE